MRGQSRPPALRSPLRLSAHRIQGAGRHCVVGLRPPLTRPLRQAPLLRIGWAALRGQPRAASRPGPSRAASWTRFPIFGRKRASTLTLKSCTSSALRAVSWVTGGSATGCLITPSNRRVSGAAGSSSATTTPIGGPSTLSEAAARPARVDGATSRRFRPKRPADRWHLARRCTMQGPYDAGKALGVPVAVGKTGFAGRAG
jgi:hypothetical protein